MKKVKSPPKQPLGGLLTFFIFFERSSLIVYFENFEKYVGQCCVVRFNGEQEMFRKLQLKKDSPVSFELVALNNSEIVVPDTIEWVAPLARRWKYQF